MSTDKPADEDILLDLTFVPDWARRPAVKNPYVSYAQSAAGRADKFSAGREQEYRPRRGVREQKRLSHSKSPPAAKHAAQPGRESKTDAFRQTASSQVLLPLEVSFLPERRGIRPLARWLAATRRAHALMEIAFKLLSRPEYYTVKIELPTPSESTEPLSLFQCKACKLVFTDREKALSHGFAAHFDLFYKQEEIKHEPPKGKFLCIARCGFSGELLGPPNYHGFNERLIELHRERFASIPLEEYRKKVVNDTDTAVIEQWKEDASRQVVYHTRPAQNEVPQTFQRRSEMETYFRQHQAPELIQAGNRFLIPGQASRLLEDAIIARAIHQAWLKASRFPLKIAIALQIALRRHGLIAFKTANRHIFITSIPPRPLDPAQALQIVRRILEHLQQHPGVGRTGLKEALFPEVDNNAEPVQDFINHLRWLIDRGHVIEFTDGTLATPRRPSVPPVESGSAPA